MTKRVRTEAEKVKESCGTGYEFFCNLANRIIEVGLTPELLEGRHLTKKVREAEAAGIINMCDTCFNFCKSRNECGSGCGNYYCDYCEDDSLKRCNGDCTDYYCEECLEEDLCPACVDDVVSCGIEDCTFPARKYRGNACNGECGEKICDFHFTNGYKTCKHCESSSSSIEQ